MGMDEIRQPGWRLSMAWWVVTVIAVGLGLCPQTLRAASSQQTHPSSGSQQFSQMGKDGRRALRNDPSTSGHAEVPRVHRHERYRCVMVNGEVRHSVQDIGAAYPSAVNEVCQREKISAMPRSSRR